MKNSGGSSGGTDVLDPGSTASPRDHVFGPEAQALLRKVLEAVESQQAKHEDHVNRILQELVPHIKKNNEENKTSAPPETIAAAAASAAVEQFFVSLASPNKNSQTSAGQRASTGKTADAAPPANSPTDENDLDEEEAFEKMTSSRTVKGSLWGRSVESGRNSVSSADGSSDFKRHYSVASNQWDPITGQSNVDGVAKGSRAPPWMVALVNNLLFDYFVAFTILTNAVVIGLQTHWRAQNVHENDPEFWIHLEWVFCLIFTFELICRLTVEQEQFLFGMNRKWNLFDVLVVLFQMMELIFNIPELTQNRVLRVLRLVRVFRILRIMRFLHDLRKMIMGILMTLSSLMWAMILLMMVMFVFAVVMTENVTSFRAVGEVDENLSDGFGSLTITLFSLFKAISGGEDWGTFANPLVEVNGETGWLFGLLFSMYISFAIFCVLNIVTAVFVDYANRICVDEEVKKHAKLIDDLSRIFSIADSDQEGTLDLCEFENYLSQVQVQEYFRKIELDIDNIGAKNLFNLLDFHCVGEIDVAQFTQGISRLKGSAKSFDMYRLHQEIMRLDHKVHHVMEMTEDVCAPVGNMLACLGDKFGCGGNFPPRCASGSSLRQGTKRDSANAARRTFFADQRKATVKDPGAINPGAKKSTSQEKGKMRDGSDNAGAAKAKEKDAVPPDDQPNAGSVAHGQHENLPIEGEAIEQSPGGRGRGRGRGATSKQSAAPRESLLKPGAVPETASSQQVEGFVKEASTDKKTQDADKKKKQTTAPAKNKGPTKKAAAHPPSEGNKTGTASTTPPAPNPPQDAAHDATPKAGAEKKRESITKTTKASPTKKAQATASNPTSSTPEQRIPSQEQVVDDSSTEASTVLPPTTQNIAASPVEPIAEESIEEVEQERAASPRPEQ